MVVLYNKYNNYNYIIIIITSNKKNFYKNQEPGSRDDEAIKSTETRIDDEAIKSAETRMHNM